jgi:hypothetical protein
MRMNVKHVQKRGQNEWRYRRKVPAPLQAVIGKREIVTPLGGSEAEALRRYPKTHAAAEKLLKDATQRLLKGGTAPALLQPKSPLDRYLESQRRLRDLGLDADWAGADEDDDGEAVAREVISEGIVKNLPVDEHGDPIGIGSDQAALLRALAYGARDVRPEPTLEDARKLYLREKVGDDERKQAQLAQVFKLVREALGSDRKLSSLRREDAKEVRDHMLDGRAAASVDRYLNVVRAVINYAMEEYDLSIRNPFMKLEAAPRDKAEPDRTRRRSFTDAEVGQQDRPAPERDT